MKNKICKNCGKEKDYHLKANKTLYCSNSQLDSKKFEPVSVPENKGCGKEMFRGATGNYPCGKTSWGLCKDCEPKNHNESEDASKVRIEAGQSSGSNNSPQSRSETPNKKQNEDNLSSKIEELQEEVYDELYHEHDGLEEFAQEVSDKIGEIKLDIKDFIKKLENFKWEQNGNYVQQINNFFVYLRKEAGKELLE